MLKGSVGARRMLFACVMLSLQAYAAPGITMSESLMGYTAAIKQSGQVTQGASIFSETQLQYQGKWWGFGLFFQYDMQGANEKDLAAGPKLEVNWDPFYLEYGHLYLMQRTFTSAAIGRQSGDGYFVGVGGRFRLRTVSSGGGSTSCAGGAGIVGTNGCIIKPYGMFLQFNYKHRVQTVKKQSGDSLSAPIVKTDGYPLFGLGFQF